MKNLYFILILVCGFTATAQSIKVKGAIKDSLGAPLELANVVASIKADGKLESYAITNYEGRFQLSLPKNNTYVLKASFLGYSPQEKELTVPEESEDINLDFILQPLANQLDGVEITYEMPVTVRGDTIVYNADSFKTGEERKLGDVLKNLPGIEVNDDGEIEVEGKAVTKVMVDGKDFFDGDSKLATKNIPADAVDKVQVLRNYNEVDQLRGVQNNQDNVAINIKLKEGKKNFWFGEVTAGGGLVGDDEAGYLAHPKLFYYSPKYSLNFITDFNNVGEVPFTFRDYFNFTGGFRNFNRGGGTNFSISESDLGFAVAQNNRANEIETKFFAGNFSYQASENLDLSGFGILSDNSTNIINNSIRRFITSGSIENTNSVNDQTSRLGMLKLSGVYKPNANLQIDYDVLTKGSKQEQDDLTTSIFDGNTNNIVEGKENTPFSVNQNVNAYYTLNENHIFAGQIQHLYQDEDPFYNAITDLLPFPGILPVDENQDRYNINQNKNVKTNKIDGKVDYYYILNNVSNLNFTLGTTYSNQQFGSNIFQILDNNSRVDFSETPPVDGENLPLVNDVEFAFSDVFLGMHYKLKSGQFIITPGLTLHNYNVKSDQLGASTSKNDWKVLPDFNIIWNIKKSESLRFNYDVAAQYTDVNDYAEAFVFNNYNRLFSGNRNLENALSHNYSLAYFSFNLFNNTNISGALNYSRRLNGYKNDTQIVAINQVSSPFNIDSNFPDETYTAFGRYSKRIKKLQINLSGNVSVNKSNNLINDVVRESESFTQNYRGSVRTNFRDWPNFEAGYRLNINQYDNGGLSQTFFTQRPFANVDVRFLKDFTFDAEWDYYNYNNDEKTVENTYSFVNANIYYKKGDSSWEFRVQATNLLNTEFINSDNFSEQFNTTSQYYVLPRILMFVVKYEL
jgi:hypothetical protein